MIKVIRTQHDIIAYPDIPDLTTYQKLITLMEFGSTHDSNGYYLARRKWHYSVIFYCETGRGEVIYRDRHLPFVKGDTIILPEGTSHILISDPDDPFIVKWINVSGPAVNNLMTTYGIFAPVVFSNVDTEGLITSYHTILHSSLDAQEIISNTLLLITAIIHTCVLPAVSKIDSQNHLAQEIKAYIDHHSQNSNLSVSQIADVMEIPLSKVTKVFQSAFGISPHNYITNQRIENSKLLLRSTNLPIKDIAENMGFSDSNYFFAFFKKNTGISPGVYRRKNLQDTTE